MSGNPPQITYRDPGAPVQTSAEFAPVQQDIEMAEARPLAVILGTDGADFEEQEDGGMEDIEGDNDGEAETELFTTAHWANRGRGSGQNSGGSGDEASNRSALEISAHYVRVLGNASSK